MSKTRESSSPTMRKTAAKYQPTQEEIALRAYEIYMERDGAPGDEVEDWIQAERQLIEKHANGGNGRGKPSAKAKAA
jgi:hypothetical protein